MVEQERPYESPLKQQIEERLRTARPEMRSLWEDALQRLDHTDPRKIGELLPPRTYDFYLQTAQRALTLMPLAQHAHEAGCYIESIVLFHGLALFCLRGLLGLAWQRAVMPRPLTPDELRPYDSKNTRPGEMPRLVDWLEKDGLLSEIHATQMRRLNDVRNQAAHGVIFGEITTEELARASREGLTAAQWIVDCFTMWISSPQPLKTLPRRVAG